MHHLLAWAFAVVFTVLGGWVIALNFAVFYLQFTRQRQHSWIPLIGGFLAFFGMAACPLRPSSDSPGFPSSSTLVACLAFCSRSSMLIYMIVSPRRREETTRADEPQ
jgi:hypothetical protein